MNAITLISMIIFYFVVANSEISHDDFMKKFCKSDANIVELEKCTRLLPEEVNTSAIKCLEDMKKGTTFKDVWKISCDLSTRNQFEECRIKKIDFEALNKKYNRTEIKLNLMGCFNKVWDIKN